MGLWDRIQGEFVDIIEWLDDSRDTIVWRFPRFQNEIKMGAQLIVRESQTAVFVNEGQVADVFKPGTHTLTTQNLPILSTLKGWKYGFESPWKAEVYFVNTRQFTDLKWGTQNPVMLRDAEFGMVRLRAFGAYALQVTEPDKLLRELVGTDPQFRTEEVSEFVRQLIVGHLGSALATAQVPVLDLAARQLEIGQRLAGVLTSELTGYGIQIPKFVIENISVPPEVEEAIDKRTSMGVVGNLDNYTRFQTANAIEDAANNSGGAGEAFGFGLGMAAGQRMTNAATQGAPPSGGPPPLPQQDQWFAGIGGAQQGPYDLAGLGAQIRGGTVTRETLVWHNGMAQWTPAGQVPELGALFAAVPPPLPPQA
ncbi:SPFH domain-containing protein [Dactylosporangium siamense]|uniref:Antifreeze protein, type I n=1 Tax=Dactylosporangium siamense TaxID=685454 RepID=A0A919PIP3_9ACTN|nr:SPFH domain-containing protein [Dactylosporangium siamense]GIG42923.1 antifreeze protein, type I [Dactylosporangium siamense]